MSGAIVIFRRELASLFLAPLGWVLLVLALFLNGLFVTLLLEGTGGDLNALMRGALGGGTLFWAMLVFLPPLLAMRMLTEEARTGTLEYLFTAPVTATALVLGKWAAATAFLALLWLEVPLLGLFCQIEGSPPDWGALLASWLGAVLASGLFVSLGLLAATLTSTPLVAAFLAFCLCLGWLLLPTFGAELLTSAEALLQGSGLGQRLLALLRSLLESMDVLRHFHYSWRIGVLDSAELCFFLTWPAFFLFLAVQLLDARRWRP